MSKEIGILLPRLYVVSEKSLNVTFLVCPLQARNDRTDIGTLLIPNIKMADSGTYMCVGSNSIGSNSAPIKVSVLKG